MRKILLIISIVLVCFSCERDLNLTVPLIKDVPTGTGSGNPSVPDNEIIFTPAQLMLPKKKGVCFTLRGDEVSMAKTILLKGGWNYSWGNELKSNQPRDIEFVPMFWTMNVANNPMNDIQRVRGYMLSGQCKRVLAFNEPDAKTQANMTVAAAIDRWPYLQSLRVPLGSPAATSYKGEWMEEFMRIAEERKYRVDYICIHSYPGPNAESFKNLIRAVYEKYKKPILITEFAVADWNATSVANNRHTAAQTLAFMKEVLPFLENTDYVLGYCWFSFNTTSIPGAPSALFDQDNNLTELGEWYANFSSK